MKKIFAFLLLGLLFSCSSNGPTGNPEKDAEQFAKEIKAAYDDASVEKMKNVIDIYYEFYKNRNEIDIKVFFDAWKNYFFDKMGEEIDKEKFVKMAQEADKFGKLDMLYKNSK